MKNNFTSTTFKLGILQKKKKKNIMKFFIEKSIKFGSGGIMSQEKEYRP
jgi:hypothetical protein